MTMPNLTMTCDVPQLWAIRPEAVPAALAAFCSAAGQQPQVRVSARERATAQGYTVEDGLAVVPVRGTLTKTGLRYGDTVFLESMRNIGATLREASTDPSARAILLDVESPGGTVDGIEELSEAVVAAGALKPLYAYADGLMASAAYWLSCSARAIAAPATANIGSIGVISVHAEYSKMLEASGVKVNILSAGKYKAAGNNVEPLSDEMRAYIQSGIDDLYEMFLAAVQTGRRCDRKKALAMADGKLFLAEAAQAVGLIDRVCSRQTFVAEIKRSLTMSIDDLRVQHPAEVAELRAKLEKEMAATAKAERDKAAADARVAATASVLEMAGAVLGKAAGEKLAAVVASGVTAAQLAALSGVLTVQTQNAQRDTAGGFGQQMLDAMRDAHSHAQVDGRPQAAPTAKAEFASLVAEHQKAHGCTRGEAIRACAAAHSAEHAAWVKAQQKGEQR